MENIIIRPERPEEYRAVENLVREAFWNVYRPGCMEHYVLHQLRQDPAFVPELDLALLRREEDGGETLMGQVMFMQAELQGDDGSWLPLCTLGPIGIAPEFQGQGCGKLLLDAALEKAKELGMGAVVLEGDAGFYGKSGFRPAADYGIRYHGLPEGEDASFFLCRELLPGYLASAAGEYATPEGYFVEDAAVEEFDRQFPPKEKLRLPGQLF